MKYLIAPAYLPNISYMSWLIKRKIYFNLTDKYNKQTFEIDLKFMVQTENLF